MSLDKEDLERIYRLSHSWLGEEYDEPTRLQVTQLIDSYKRGEVLSLIDAFYKNLEFGTGGIRGKMGVGTNRINHYTLGLVTQGLSNYARKYFSSDDGVKVVIAYDTRNWSRELALSTAKIFLANQIKVYLFREPRPTPELSFAIRHLKCHLGVVITASHNTKEYNGYKVYFEDGGQIISPWDKEIMEEVAQITSFDQVNTNFAQINDVVEIGEEIDQAFFSSIEDVLFSSPAERRGFKTPILYTPLHGTGFFSIYPCLKQIGFEQFNLLLSQSNPDGNFPTVISPNPEEEVALQMGIAKMKEENFKLLLATDPDSDRLGVVLRNDLVGKRRGEDVGEFYRFSGNQIGVLLSHYIFENLQKQGRLTQGFAVRTIVTSRMIDCIASKYHIPVYSVLTGFKYIAEVIRLKEHTKESFIFGMEESYGYLVGDFTRDKDAVSACAMFVEMFYHLEKQGISLLDQLDRLYLEFGYFTDGLKSVVKEGKEGIEEIAEIMQSYRTHHLKEIAGIKVKIVRDFLISKEWNYIDRSEKKIDLPPSNVMQFELIDGSMISVRPSGTEPKVKYYFNVQESINSGLKIVKQQGEAKLKQLQSFFDR